MKEYTLQHVTIDDKSFFQAYVLLGEDWNGFVLPYFTVDEATKLCSELNEKRKNQWFVKNATDNIIASPNLDKSVAEKYAEELRQKFVRQGFYLNSKGEKIKPESVNLQLVKAEDTSPESYYDKDSDTFVIQEIIDEDEYEPVEYSGEDIEINGNNIHVYSIGAGSWIWSIATRLN